VSVIPRVVRTLLDRLPKPSLRVQRAAGAAAIVSQAGIAVTGSVVRVTSSGLGCPTWPRCFPGSFVPVGPSTVPELHQAIEFANRMFTFVVVLCAASAVLVVAGAHRRREVLGYAWAMPAGTVVQAVLGGITVRTGLLWWTVALHLLASMAMVWLAVLLYAEIGRPDDAVVALRTPGPLRLLVALIGLALAATLVAGTMVTGAGPHAGDESSVKTVPRLSLPIVDLVHAHAQFVVALLALLIGLLCGLHAVGAARVLLVRAWTLLGVVLAQGLVGIVQYFTHVPAALVSIHVAGAAACTAATAALWSALTVRESVAAPAPAPVPVG
jgi:heme a synthase